MTEPDAEAVLHFWFKEATPQQWWMRDDTFDAEIRERFGALHAKAAVGELWNWRSSAKGRLAEIILLDQFSRNLFRDKPQAFAHDSTALVLMQEAIACGDDKKLSDDERHFLYMPAMHSESRTIHEQAVTLYKALGKPQALEYEQKHKAIIDRFGRYPHRNHVLGRASTPEETAFLQEPDSSF